MNELENKDEAGTLTNIATFLITAEGDIVVVSTAKITKKQEKVITKIIVAANKDSSIIFKSVLFLEILFQNIFYKLKSMF